MATDVERLVVSLEANIKRYEREMAKARGVTESALRDVERSVSSGGDKIEARMVQVGRSIRLGIAGAIAGISVGKFTELTDAYTRIQNSLKVTGLEGDKLKATYQELFALAQKQGVPLETLSGLYSRAAQSQKELNATSGELVIFTNSVATALRAGGVGAVQADQALTQLGQALGSGKVQWEELGSIIDSAPTLLQAAAAGIKEAEGSVGKLTQLVKEGKVSSEALFRAIIAGLPAIKALADRTSETSSQGVARLKNALTDLAGEFAKSSGASGIAVKALDRASESIERITKQIPGAIEALSSYFEKLSKAPYFQSLVQSIAASQGGDTPIEAAAPGFKPAGKAARPMEGIDKLRDAMKERAKLAAEADKKVGKGGNSIFDQVAEIDRKALAGEPISLEKFPVPGKKEKKEGGGSKEKQNELQRETAAIVKRTGALGSEMATVGKSAGAAAEAEAKFKLLEAAKKANVAVGPALLADIERTAKAYGAATEALEKVEEAQRRASDTQRYFGQAATDALGDLVIEGRGAAEVFENLTKSLAKAALQAALLGTGPLASFFGSPAGSNGTGGGILGSLLSSLPGRAAGGGIKGPGTSTSDSILARLSNGEFVMNAKAAKAYGPLLEQLNRGVPGFATGGWVGSPGAEVGAEAGFGKVLSR
ncbi:tape measure protein [Methylorubrum extorquens]